MNHRRHFVGGLTITALLLTGCAPAAPTESFAPAISATPTPTPTPTDSPSPVAGRSVFGVDCNDLVPDPSTIPVLGVGTSLVNEEVRPRLANTWRAPEIAVLQDGGLHCVWLTEEDRYSLVMTALDDAADGFDRAAPQYQNEYYHYEDAGIGDRSLADCRDWYAGAVVCEWSALQDGVWLSAGFFDVAATEFTIPEVREQPDGSFAVPQPVLDSAASAIVDHALSALSSSIRNSRYEATTTVPSCDALVDPDALANSAVIDTGSLTESATGLEDSLGRATPHTGFVEGYLAIERQGFVDCYVSLGAGESWVELVVANEAAELLSSSRFTQMTEPYCHENLHDANSCEYVLFIDDSAVIVSVAPDTQVGLISEIERQLRETLH